MVELIKICLVALACPLLLPLVVEGDSDGAD